MDDYPYKADPPLEQADDRQPELKAAVAEGPGSRVSRSAPHGRFISITCASSSTPAGAKPSIRSLMKGFGSRSRLYDSFETAVSARATAVAEEKAIYVDHLRAAI